ncbi:hypothetical protein KIN20_022178 [Parelaphostrongylus tenuis]|uniref:Uncharacterized protein n=1 Tax=Parelaphostrongylus tenuis TaxID=148309 RepID=A0AAD5QWM2_PARTN|nr:hypothetical protein KIN20_022178 [Parelaphostrongylus tenuis]
MQTILRGISTLIIVILPYSASEFCGNNRIPFGIEVHKDGHLILLCSRPNCHEKKYAECDERALVKSCSSDTSWVGGLQKTVDDQLYLQCCEYPLMKDYAKLIYNNVVVRRGEFFEAEERYDKNDEDVLHFDLISNIKRGEDDKGEYYSLTIHRYFCGRIPDTPPACLLEVGMTCLDEDKPYQLGLVEVSRRARVGILRLPYAMKSAINRFERTSRRDSFNSNTLCDDAHEEDGNLWITEDFWARTILQQCGGLAAD